MEKSRKNEKEHPKLGAAQPGAAERGAAESGAAERGAAERGVAERGVAERGVAERGVAERGVAERGTAERGAAESGAAELGAAEQFDTTQTISPQAKRQRHEDNTREGSDDALHSQPDNGIEPPPKEEEILQTKWDENIKLLIHGLRHFYGCLLNSADDQVLKNAIDSEEGVQLIGQIQSLILQNAPKVYEKLPPEEPEKMYDQIPLPHDFDTPDNFLAGCKDLIMKLEKNYSTYNSIHEGLNEFTKEQKSKFDILSFHVFEMFFQIVGQIYFLFNKKEMSEKERMSLLLCLK